MTKKISISISDYIYEIIFSNYFGNRSRYAESLLLKGFEYESGEWEQNKARLNKVLTANRLKDDEIKKLKTEVAKLQSHLGKRNTRFIQDPTLEQREKNVEAMKRAGFLRRGPI